MQSLILALLLLTQTFRSPAPGSSLTLGSASGVTGVDTGSGLAKVTVSRTGIVCASTNCDITLATLPAKTKIVGLVAEVTQTFACTATCTSSTLSITAGKTAGGTEYLLSFDVDAALIRVGLSSATAGASLVASAAGGGDVPSWTGTTTLQMRFISGTGNIGNGSATNLSQGSVDFYIQYLIYQ